MNISKKFLFILSLIILIESNVTLSYAAQANDVINASVLFYNTDDDYIKSLKENLEKVQEDPNNKMSFEYFNAHDSQTIQNNQLNEVLKKKPDIIFLNIVDITYIDSVIEKIKLKNIPVVVFNRQPKSLTAIQSYGKSVYVGSNNIDVGILQGKIIKKKWDKDKFKIDKNNDNVLQYIMIKGERNNVDTENRSNYVIKFLKESNIKTYELASEYCNWDRETAKKTLKKLIYGYGNSIEAVICNNDEMAIGCVEALQENGYITQTSNNIIVVGIDGLKEAIKLVEENLMTGTVIQDTTEITNAMVAIGKNLVYGNKPLKDTKYKFDSTGVCVLLPYTKYIMN
ncbi:galactose ABC transporter substrate-binding protein [Clostridium sp. BJN0001]|uniref:galactose ABC transporter substrate-binding protein n=1 Tax=Clostridium sp. BJN0001 TaxID=2930219 RepID=UPI001FD4B716|nr:galactose ABC transporter substrate-binding protein [Clostridium sp. BJN0001]